jgi:hypothetical protein
MIDFEWYIQFNKNDAYRQRSIERREIDISQYVRKERFLYPQWEEQNKQIIAETNCAEIAELAAKGRKSGWCKYLKMQNSLSLLIGILKEGKFLNKEYDA